MSMPEIWSDYGRVTRPNGMVFEYLPRLAVAKTPTVDGSCGLTSVCSETSRRIDLALRWGRMHHNRRPHDVMGCRLPDDLLKFMGSVDFL